MALIIDLAFATEAVRFGTNLIKAIFRGSALTFEFQKEEFSDARERLSHRFEWHIARNIDENEELLIMLMCKTVAFRQYGLIRLKLRDVLNRDKTEETDMDVGAVKSPTLETFHVQEQFKDEKHAGTGIVADITLFYKSPTSIAADSDIDNDETTTHEHSPFLQKASRGADAAEASATRCQKSSLHSLRPSLEASGAKAKTSKTQSSISLLNDDDDAGSSTETEKSFPVSSKRRSGRSSTMAMSRTARKAKASIASLFSSKAKRRRQLHHSQQDISAATVADRKHHSTTSRSSGNRNPFDEEEPFLEEESMGQKRTSRKRDSIEVDVDEFESNELNLIQLGPQETTTVEDATTHPAAATTVSTPATSVSLETAPIILPTSSRSLSKMDSSMKQSNFQVCVTIIEARQLSGLNMDPCVCILIGDQKKSTSVKESTNSPYYNEYFVFDFHMATDLFLDQILTLSVFQSRKLLRNSLLIGLFKMDIGTVSAQPDRQFHHKWAMITDPMDPNGGPKGYVKCSIVVNSQEEPLKMSSPLIDSTSKAEPSYRSADQDDSIEGNLLLPAGFDTERQRAKYVLKVYRAEGLPSAMPGVLANVRRAFSAQSHLELFVEVSFAGQTARTSICKGSTRPAWNESITFAEMFPPLVRRLRLQVCDASFSGDVVATHFIDLAAISDEGRRGFLPTFGPCWCYLYGSTTDGQLSGEKMLELNQGLGEGVAYRGRILVEFKVELPEITTTLPVHTSVEPCLPLAEGLVGKKELFLLFACILEVSMLDRKLSDKQVQVELSMGDVTFDASRDASPGSSRPASASMDASAECFSPSARIQLKQKQQCVYRNVSVPAKAVSRNNVNYYLAFENNKQCLFVAETFPDQRRRIYNSNALTRFCERSWQQLETVSVLLQEHGISQDAEHHFKSSLDCIIQDCGQFLNILRNKSSASSTGQTKLDKERSRKLQREMDRTSSLLRNIRLSAAKTNLYAKLAEVKLLLENIDSLVFEPQHSLPDIFLWLIADGRRMGYQRLRASDLLSSAIDDQRGMHCGITQSFFLKTPGRTATYGETVGHIKAYIWLGMNKAKTGFLGGLPKGYELTREIIDAENANGLLPLVISYTEKHCYELRCHIYQARALLGGDDSGLSDAFVRIVFEGRSAATQVIEQTVNPMWDETLVLSNVDIFGDVTDVKTNPPSVIVQVFDEDSPEDNADFIGQLSAKCSVKLISEPYVKPTLAWHAVHRGYEKAGEILAAFELLEIAAEDQLNNFPAIPGAASRRRTGSNASLAKQTPSKKSITSTKGPIMVVPLPDFVRPALCKYRLEVLFWGLRDLKRVNLSSVERPQIIIECAGRSLHSSIIANYAKNPNFTTLIQGCDLHLPEDLSYLPPITIRCIDCRNYGRHIFVGSHTVANIEAYMQKPKMHFIPKLKVSDSLGSVRPDHVIIRIDGEPALISCDTNTASDTLTRKNAAAVSPKKQKHSASSEKEDDFSSQDWWSKYFSSLEALSATKVTKSKKSPVKDVVEKGFYKLASIKGNKLTAVKNVLQPSKAGVPITRKSDTDLPSLNLSFAKDYTIKLVIYRTELERVADFDGFNDYLKSFDLRRGKQIIGAQANSSKIVGSLKGDLKLCKYPLPTDHHKKLFSSHVSNNDPITVLVRVYVVKANNLHPADLNGKADPYCVIQLGRTKTSDKENYISKQLNPVFGKCFEVEAVFPFENLLTVQIYDWDLVGRDDLIGETKIDLENRFYSAHRATCGLSYKYETTGCNAWRDPVRPSQILAKMCKDYQLEGPFYMPGQVRVGGKSFLVPPLPGESTSSSKVDAEPLALFALRNWHQVPLVGCHLVPEHMETRPLYHPDKPGIEQGQLEMWIDMFPMDMLALPPPVDISPRKPKSYELRVIIWNTDDVILEDDSLATGEKMSDIYVKGWIKGAEDCQSTDVHYRSYHFPEYRSLTGEGNFNWRFVFPFEYLEAEEKILISRKETIFSWDETQLKIPPRLQMQVWDADAFSADDFLGALAIDLIHFPRGAKTSKSCNLSMLDPNKDVQTVNIFKHKRLKGWWPFCAKNEEGQLELTGKVEAEICLVTAEEAERNPVGLGRNEPEALEKPNRPDTSFVWFISPLKSLKYVLWRNYRWLIVKLFVLLLILLLFLLFIYSVPGYVAKRMLGA